MASPSCLKPRIEGAKPLSHTLGGCRTSRSLGNGLCCDSARPLPRRPILDRRTSALDRILKPGRHEQLAGKQPARYPHLYRRAGDSYQCIVDYGIGYIEPVCSGHRPARSLLAETEKRKGDTDAETALRVRQLIAAERRVLLLVRLDGVLSFRRLLRGRQSGIAIRRSPVDRRAGAAKANHLVDRILGRHSGSRRPCRRLGGARRRNAHGVANPEGRGDLHPVAAFGET